MTRKHIDALLWVWDGRGQRPHANTLRALERGEWIWRESPGQPWGLNPDGSIYVQAYLRGFRDGSDVVRGDR